MVRFAEAEATVPMILEILGNEIVESEGPTYINYIVCIICIHV